MGAVASVAGAVVGGIADIKTAKAQGRQSERNARVAEQIARQALWRGELEGQRAGEELAARAGAQRTAVAGSGFAVQAGTPLEILADTAAAGAIDAELIRYNARLEAWSSRVDAANARNQAALTRWGAPIHAAAGVASSIGGSMGRGGGGTILGDGRSGSGAASGRAWSSLGRSGPGGYR